MNLFKTIALSLFKIPQQQEYIQSSSNFWNGDNLIGFDGEKTPYEMGMPKDFHLNYSSLRARSWESYIKSDVVQNAIKKYILWIVGSGLKLQSQPVENIIEDFDNSFENKKFISKIESYFRLYAKSKESDYANMQNLHEHAIDALKNAIIAGDVLVLTRYDGKNVTMQLVDGYYVQQPSFDSKYIKQAERSGNTIIEGVEINKKGQHIAFYVREENLKYKRIKARANGRIQAWLMHGLKHKITDVRGMSLFTAVLETVTKLDRYKEATLGTAEENAKLVYTIEHQQFSDGENPFIKNFQQSMGRGQGVAPESESSEKNAATKIQQSTNKQTVNLPIGAKLQQHGGMVDVNFKDFFEINTDIIYATLGIPPEVAMDKFGGAYSGSRAALKSWEYKMAVDRVRSLDNQFYKPFFDFWLDINILSNTIDVPGYLTALISKNSILLSAYRNCRFIGVGVPHIDPVKEVTAERRKLGAKYNDVPLTTAEQSAEALNTGDFESIMTKAEREKEIFEEFIKPESWQVEKQNIVPSKTAL